jgi:hypothetical protein
MKWRWITAVVCMLYMSVGLVAAISHDHSGHTLDGHQQCEACAWHHDTQIDVPIVAACVHAPSTFILGCEIPAIFVSGSFVGVQRSRGPPSIPQL